ncbi:MAG: DUF3285 domain-containing protein [Cyanobacteriota bacterium]|nr:DUF3285 domain-containing protein [Cyanobacteriota bacterium]
MNDSPNPTQTPTPNPTQAPVSSPAGEPQPSYVKLAMRNMVRKGKKSATHFAITAFTLLALLVGVSYLTR